MPKNKRSVSYLHHRRWSITQARAALADLDSSGLSTVDFARRQGLEVNRLYRWQRRLDGSVVSGSPASTAPAVIEIRPRRAEPVEIIFGSGRVLRVAETVDPAALARIIGVRERSEGC